MSIFVGCTATYKITDEQQALLDTVWDNRTTWEEITGYIVGDGPCDHISFGEYNGELILSVSRFGNGNTLMTNVYYVYPNEIVKMDYDNSMRFKLGLYSDSEWNSTNTKDDLTQIYTNYLKKK